MFTITAYHNPFLRVNQTAMQAVLSVKVDEQLAVGPTPQALAIALDRSGSMDGAKISAAREGAIKIVQALDESMLFMVVTFNDSGSVLAGPVLATTENKKQAIAALQRVRPAGGTRMSAALNLIADKLQHEQARALKILFLTDGRNEGETRAQLNKAVARCAEVHISISAWGVGTDWDAAELRHIADATHGSADIIPTPRQVEAAFTQAFQEMRKTAISNARLLLWSPNGVRITRIEQVYPSIVPLGLEPDAGNPRQVVASLGSLAAGDQRDYLLHLEMPAYPIGQQFMLIRPTLRFQAGGMQELEEKSARSGWVFVQWTENAAQAAQIEEHIAHYTNQEELSRSIKEGQEALAAGDSEKATRLLGRALEISESTNNERITRLLNDIVERDARGTIHLSQRADAVARKTLAINTGRTSKLK
ncbi:vWA domain-containing protein [Dictyobacter kobayashii]|uniref:VWA domain-containing protein n=1 Tax=Dictyobacter kobayashii TaxID=2014872 RepID=A0A402ALU6_9CHLR|nr:vWA domain-containing protein [Dictyobacter kobayashii]GCE20009.1 VWA domain-containing protein [Dictyobacter kobayashii]